jgi:hypothetical protein
MTVAEKKNYGTNEQELAIWEINNPVMYLTSERQKTYSSEKQARQKLGVKIKALDKVF